MISRLHMNLQDVPTAHGEGLLPNTPAKLSVRRTSALTRSVYYLLAYFALAGAIPIFAKLFKELSVELPLLTRLLMGNYSWLFPVLFVGAVILTIAKEFLTVKRLPLRVVNLFLGVVGIGFVPLAILALYMPLFDLIRKLSK